MKIELRLLQDDGTPILEHTATVDNLGTPIQWRPVNGQTIRLGHYQLFGFAYQPQVRSLHPSGYQAEQTPFNGVQPQPRVFPQTTAAPTKNPLIG